MRGPLGLHLSLLVAAATLLSGCGGCGSTKKAGTGSSTRTNVSTGASASLGAHAGRRGATTSKPQIAEPKPEPSQAPETQKFLGKREANLRAAATPTLAVAEMDLPVARRYPKELQGKFMSACKAAKGSTSSCECIIIKQEANLKVERGQSLAELLAVEIAFEREHASLEDIRRHRVPSPRLVRRAIRACR
jgi:hypothetical protein